MRTVAWNMGCGPNASPYRNQGEGWEYLLGDRRPEVTFVPGALGAGVTAGAVILVRGATDADAGGAS